MADCGGVFHRVAGHHDFEYRCSDDRGRAARGAPQHEVGAVKLHAESGGVYPHQWVDGGPLRDPAGVCIGDWAVHLGIVSVRDIDAHSRIGGVPHFAGLRRRDDGAGGPTDDGADVREIATDPGDEFRGGSRTDRADARAHRRRVDRGVLPLADDFLCEYSDWADGLVPGLPEFAGLPRGARRSARYRGADFVWFGCGAVFLRAGGVWRTYPRPDRNTGAAGARGGTAGRIRIARHANRASDAEPEVVQDPHVSLGGERQFYDQARYRGNSVFVSAAVPSRIGVLADRVRVVDDAASDSSDEFEDDHAANPGTVRISNGIGVEHAFHRVADSAVFDHCTRRAGVVDRDDGVLLRLFHFVAVHEHEYAGVCGRYRRASKRREFDCQHPAADVDQFRCGHGIAGHGGVSAGPLSGQSDAIHPRNSPGIWGVGCYDGAVDAGISRVAARRWRGGEPGAATASLI